MKEMHMRLNKILDEVIFKEVYEEVKVKCKFHYHPSEPSTKAVTGTPALKRVGCIGRYSEEPSKGWQPKSPITRRMSNPSA